MTDGGEWKCAFLHVTSLFRRYHCPYSSLYRQAPLEVSANLQRIAWRKPGTALESWTGLALAAPPVDQLVLSRQGWLGS